MSKFTKGPWEVYGNEVVFDHRYQECCGQGGHNGCCGEPIAAGEAGSICECNDPETANFIAAAPDLYEALQAMLEFPNAGPSHDMARAALAKATP